MKKGFTLIEIVVALLIFSLIAVMAAEGLSFLIRAESTIKQQGDELQALQMTFLLMERNLSQTIDRPISIAQNIKSPAFVGDSSSIEFTHGGYLNPEGQFARSTLQRTAYLLENGALIERDWPVLDRVPKTLPRDRVLLKATETIKFRFIDDQNNFYNNWPPGGIKKEKNFQNPEGPLPRAIQLTISLAENNNIVRVFMCRGKQLGK